MKNITTVLFLFAGIISGAYAQGTHLRTLAKLPANIIESSGITVNPDGTLWTHNDSGDKPRIYKIDTTGHLLKTLYLKGATAVDYEDITQDAEGNVYVCDCGNNFNTRTDLRIYKIYGSDIKAGWDSVTPEIIKFRYPDQHLFPPDKSQRNFDCESIVAYHDTLFLFSKNRGKSPYCRRYSVPTSQGIYTATLIDSVKTKRWVTSAALSPDEKTFILLSENMLNIFTGFNGSNFFSGKKTVSHIPITQKEGIAFKSNNEIYLTDEVFKGFGGKLYYLKLSPGK